MKYSREVVERASIAGYRYLATDEDGQIHAYEKPPTWSEHSWVSYDGPCERVGYAGGNRGGDWVDSLYEIPPVDKNVESVREKLLLRSRAGVEKYGVTTERSDLCQIDWLRHLQEELMDACIYIEANLAKSVNSPSYENFLILFRQKLDLPKGTKEPEILQRAWEKLEEKEKEIDSLVDGLKMAETQKERFGGHDAT